MDKEILEALATCAIQCKDQEILDLIANILHGFSLESMERDRERERRGEREEG